MKKSVDANITQLIRGAVQVAPGNALSEKLARKKVLRVKLGMDPTSPDLHLGHAVVLSKLKDFQDQGHEIVFIIGDFTALIGDPSGRQKTRPPLSAQDIKANAKTYFEQVGKILDAKKTTVRYNSEWLSKMSLEDLLKLAGKTTLARIIEREDFQNRLKENLPIGFHELLYPLLQGYDSVELEADVELGGTDQTFNLLMGRHLQEQYGKEAQVIVTMPILEGLDGVQKMSKSLNNYVGLSESAEQAFGKLMSISDDLMWRYYQLLLDKDEQDIAALKKDVESGTLHPMDCKKDMAQAIIAKFWSEKEAVQGREQFSAVFQKQDYSKAQEVSLSEGFENPVWIVALLKEIGAIKTSSEAKRIIEAGGVSIDEQVIKNFNEQITHKPGMVIKVGKHRIYRLK